MITKERVIEELETIMDPEIGLDLYTLGLIYDIQVESETHVKIVMTYTTPLCPYGPAIKNEVEDAMHDIGFTSAEIEVTFTPAWKPPEKLRAMLGLGTTDKHS